MGAAVGTAGVAASIAVPIAVANHDNGDGVKKPTTGTGTGGTGTGTGTGTNPGTGAGGSTTAAITSTITKKIAPDLGSIATIKGTAHTFTYAFKLGTPAVKSKDELIAAFKTTGVSVGITAKETTDLSIPGSYSLTLHAKGAVDVTLTVTVEAAFVAR